MNTTIRDVAIVIAAVCAALLAKIGDAPFDASTRDAVAWLLGGVLSGAGAVVALFRNGVPPT